MKEIIWQKSNFRCRENIYICRPLRRLRRLAVEYVNKKANIAVVYVLYVHLFRSDELVMHMNLYICISYTIGNRGLHSDKHDIRPLCQFD